MNKVNKDILQCSFRTVEEDEWKIICSFAAVKCILGLRVVLRPDPLEFVEVVRAEDRPITCKIVKVVHDDGHKQVNNLQRQKIMWPCVKQSRVGIMWDKDNEQICSYILISYIFFASQEFCRMSSASGVVRWLSSAAWNSLCWKYPSAEVLLNSYFWYVFSAGT